MLILFSSILRISSLGTVLPTLAGLLLITGIHAIGWDCETVSAQVSTDADYEDKKGVRIRFEDEDAKSVRTLDGTILLEAQDGGLLVEGRDGSHYIVQPDKLRDRIDLPSVPTPYDADELIEQLRTELPDGFKFRETDHFLICYNTTEAYAKWNGALFERLLRGFKNYWKTRKVSLNEPRYLMVAVIFDTRENYLKYATAELGDSAKQLIGYYNPDNNRVATSDLTGVEGLLSKGSRVDSATLINEILKRPEAERSVATIVHETVHQISYNTGLQRRNADNPRWVSEGLATFFEAPDLSSQSGWRGIGKVNRFSLSNFYKTVSQWNDSTLESLISSDEQFLNNQTGPTAYARSWALTYFLLKTRTKQYKKYIDHLRQQQPYGEKQPAERLDEFKQFFGDDLPALERAFAKFIMQLRT